MKFRTVFVALGLFSAHANAETQELPNPFARPALTAAPGGGRETAAQPSPTLELRATLVRGRQSSANIGGTIVRVGGKIGNYRLISVHEGAAVLADAAGVIHVIDIDLSRQVTP